MNETEEMLKPLRDIGIDNQTAYILVGMFISGATALILRRKTELRKRDTFDTGLKIAFSVLLPLTIVAGFIIKLIYFK